MKLSKMLLEFLSMSSHLLEDSKLRETREALSQTLWWMAEEEVVGQDTNDAKARTWEFLQRFWLKQCAPDCAKGTQRLDELLVKVTDDIIEEHDLKRIWNSALMRWGSKPIFQFWLANNVDKEASAADLDEKGAAGRGNVYMTNCYRRHEEDGRRPLYEDDIKTVVASS